MTRTKVERAADGLPRESDYPEPSKCEHGQSLGFRCEICDASVALTFDQTLLELRYAIDLDGFRDAAHCEEVSRAAYAHLLAHREDAGRTL